MVSFSDWIHLDRLFICYYVDEEKSTFGFRLIHVKVQNRPNVVSLVRRSPNPLAHM